MYVLCTEQKRRGPVLILRFRHGKSHALMDLNYSGVRPDLSGFTVKGRREVGQMAFGLDWGAHLMPPIYETQLESAAWVKVDGYNQKHCSGRRGVFVLLWRQAVDESPTWAANPSTRLRARM